MPAGTPLEFIVGAAVYPLPLAPARVAGLMQLRGQPLVVLDASPAPAVGNALCRRDVLVVGKPPQAAALLVDGPPQALPEEAGTGRGCASRLRVRVGAAQRAHRRARR